MEHSLRYSGFSSCGPGGLGSCGSWALGDRLSSCGTAAYLFPSMLDLPGPGIEPMSPASAGRFSTLSHPGNSSDLPFDMG